MAAANRLLTRVWSRLQCYAQVQTRLKRYRAQNPQQAIPQEQLQLDEERERIASEEYSKEDLLAARRYRYVHPEFLPDTDPALRDIVKEKLEREDMMKRRAHIDIPEFYVGSIMAVTLSDPYADGFSSRFVGICIQREEIGLRHNFTLRNVIDNQGVEIMYELYNPTIQNIEVIKLEKRLDEELLYLRDAPHHYSEISFDLEPTPHPKGAAVPINPMKVQLNPRPWKCRWERMNLQGVEDVEALVPPRILANSKKKSVTKPWEKFDLVKKYRDTVPLEDQDLAYLHFNKEQKQLQQRKAEELDKQVKKSD